MDVLIDRAINKPLIVSSSHFKYSCLTYPVVTAHGVASSASSSVVSPSSSCSISLSMPSLSDAWEETLFFLPESTLTHRWVFCQSTVRDNNDLLGHIFPQRRAYFPVTLRYININRLVYLENFVIMHISKRIDICQLLWKDFVETGSKAVKRLRCGCIIKRTLLFKFWLRNMEMDAKTAHDTMINEKKIYHVYRLKVEIFWQKEGLI